MRPCLEFFVVALLGGCAGNADTTLDATPPGPRIGHGIYGTTIEISDVAGVPDAIYPGIPIKAYLRDNSQVSVGETTSDDHGRFELELDPGRYEACAQNADPGTISGQAEHNCAGDCTLIDVFQDPVLLDWQATLSGGWWNGGDHCPRP